MIVTNTVKFSHTKMYKLYVVLFVIVFIALCESRNVPEVKVKQGLLRGKFWESRKGRTFSGFSAIPYAKPPVEDLRFKAPISGESWEGPLDASKPHAVCPQISIYLENYPIIGNEDCLYLNVYTPQLPSSRRQLLPVMFYIHGGSLTMGSARHDWLGPEILLDKDIVLVTVNYRLGALGFLSTADEVVPGNNGLKDQALALKWVRDNIFHFGGDSKRITVFGNSAGAVSAHFHMFSPLTRNLINGAIVQSGSAFSNLSNEAAVENAKQLATLLNCSTSSSQKLVECLQSADAFEIVRQESKFASWDNESTIPFRPVIEPDSSGAYLTELPLETLKSGKAANISLMTGIVAQEVGYKSAELNSKPTLLKTLDTFFDMIVPPTFGITSDKENSSKTIREFYFGNKTIDNTTKSELTDMYTDGWYTFANDVKVRLHAQYSTKPVYQYLFDYRGSTSYSTLFGDPDYDYGVCHTDELLHLFRLGMTFPDYIPTDTDLQVSEILTTLWTNFATTGNPTPVLDAVILTKWEPVKTENLEYYHIKNYTDASMTQCLYSDRVMLWKSLPVGL